MQRKRTNTQLHKEYPVYTPLCSVFVSLALTVCLFPVPALAEIQSNAHVLLTTNETEHNSLASLVSTVQTDIEQLWASDNGSDVEQGNRWVPTETWQELACALARGEELIAAQSASTVSEEEVQSAYDALYTAWCAAQGEQQEAPSNALQNAGALSLKRIQENTSTNSTNNDENEDNNEGDSGDKQAGSQQYTSSDGEKAGATTSLSCTDEHAIIETDEGDYMADEILVTFTSNTSRARAYTSLASIEETQNNELAKAVSRIDETDITQAVSVELEEESSVLDVVQEANEKSTVSVAQPNVVYYASETSLATSNDPAVASSSTSNYREQAWHLYSINAFDAWDLIQTNNTVTVAVLDTGCNLEHEDLTNQIWQDYAYNAWLDRTLTKDYSGHGTHVAGCVAAEANNGVGTAGASYNARILPICVFDTSGEYAQTSTLVKAYNYLYDYIDELNIHVVNMSLGGYGSLSENDTLLQKCIAQAQDANVVSVCAGGNGDKQGNPKTDFSYPSDYDDCIAVTALSTASSRTPTTWCDYNECKDICAPGANIYSSYSTTTKSYKWLNGTSMAAPIVSGSLALLWALDPTLTASEAKQLIYSTADTLNLTSAQAGREGLYGCGILNIGAAVQTLYEEINRKFSVSEAPYVNNYYLVTYTGTVENEHVVRVAGTEMAQKGSVWVTLLPASEAQNLTDDDFTQTSATTRQTVRTNYDVNNNNRTNIVDAQIIYDIACGTYPDFSVLSINDMLAADVTGDNVIDAADAYALQVKLLSL